MNDERMALAFEGACFAAQQYIGQEAGIIAMVTTTPSVLFRPRLSIDGDKWCALYGDNIQDGVAGFGDSPAKAMADFDANWDRDLTTATPAE